MNFLVLWKWIHHTARSVVQKAFFFFNQFSSQQLLNKLQLIQAVFDRSDPYTTQFLSSTHCKWNGNNSLILKVINSAKPRIEGMGEIKSSYKCLLSGCMEVSSGEIVYLNHKGVISYLHIVVKKWYLIMNVLVHKKKENTFPEILKTMFFDHNQLELD